MSNAKNAVLMAAALCLLVGFIVYTHYENSENNRITSTDNSYDNENVTETANTEADLEIYNENSLISIENGIPELTCSSIRFSNSSVIFANSSGSYTLINSNHQTISSTTVQDDEGNSIILSCQKGDISFFKGPDKIESFYYGGHLIEYTNNVLYYDKSRVVYEDTAFSSYKLSDDFILKCVSKNKFKITDKKGSEVKNVTLTDDAGDSITFEPQKTGIEAVNSENYLEPAVRINGDLIVISDENVVINGVTMVPPKYNDIHTVTQKTTTAATTTETKPVTTTEPKQTTTEAVTTTVPETQKQTQTQTQTSQQTTQTTTTQTKQTEKKESNPALSAETIEMLGYVNEIRQQYGLNKLVGNSILESAAQTRAEELTRSYDHKRPDGKGFETVLDEKNLTWWHSAENIANGTNTMSTVKEAFEAWINSSGHRANILSPKMKYMAVAKKTIEKDGNTITYWEQIFFNDEYIP